MTRFQLYGIVAALVILPSVSVAQQARAPRPDSARRVVLEAQARQRMTAVIRQRLRLTDEQMQRLAPIRERNEARRRALLEQERQARAILRMELAAGDSANQARVGQQLDRLIALQRDRLAVVQQEQRELAEFLTPVQRARYQALHETLGRQQQAIPAVRRGRQGPVRPRGN